MKGSEIVKFYGTQELAAQAIGVTRGRVSQWCQTETPPLRQLQIWLLTGKALKPDRRALKELRLNGRRELP